ncbi:hypothetical protein BDV19DRAFT_398267 [Aspergillus venezuelensis]
MDLGRYLIYNGVDYKCTICERLFTSLNNLYAHCRHTLQYSWSCSQPRDFENAEELQDHSVEIHHFCPDCDIYHGSARELREHDLTQHYICSICDDHFQNTNNLRMCYGCTQTFKSFSGILIHLEFGNCQSDVLLYNSSSKQGCLAKLEHFIARNLQQRM